MTSARESAQAERSAPELSWGHSHAERLRRWGTSRGAEWPEQLGKDGRLRPQPFTMGQDIIKQCAQKLILHYCPLSRKMSDLGWESDKLKL